jgi:hypothetical protein
MTRRNDATYAYASVTGNDYEPVVDREAAGTVVSEMVPVRIHSTDGSGSFGEQAGDVVRSNVQDLEYSWDSSRFDTVFKKLEKKQRGRIKCVGSMCNAQLLTKCHWCGQHVCILHVKASNLLKGGDRNFEWVCQKHKDELNKRDIERARAFYKDNFEMIIASREADPKMMMEEVWV